MKINLLILLGFIMVQNFLYSQESGMCQQSRRHSLGWNTQGRSQYGAQMKQNQMGLQQQEQSWSQHSPDAQSTQPQRQRRGWDTASRRSYQQQMQQNHQWLQQQQGRWAQAQQHQLSQGQAGFGGTQQAEGQQQIGRGALGQSQRGAWNEVSRASYQQQMRQNHEALQQHQQMTFSSQ